MKCPATIDWATITYDEASLQNQFEHPTPKKCCDNLESNWKCHPDFERWMQNDETAISLDMGFDMKFKFDEATGDPYSCKSIEKPGYKTYGRGQAGFVTSDKQDHAPDGETLYAIVDDMADHQSESSFISSFVTVFKEMSENGYFDHDLTID